METIQICFVVWDHWAEPIWFWTCGHRWSFIGIYRVDAVSLSGLCCQNQQEMQAYQNLYTHRCWDLNATELEENVSGWPHNVGTVIFTTNRLPVNSPKQLNTLLAWIAAAQKSVQKRTSTHLDANATLYIHSSRQTLRHTALRFRVQTLVIAVYSISW